MSEIVDFDAKARRTSSVVTPMTRRSDGASAGPLGPQLPTPAGGTDDVEVSIVVPTRNEEQNVVLLTTRLAAAMPDDVSWEIVVVDDSSDATPAVVKELLASGVPGQLLHRLPDERVGGLGGAVLAGFHAARGRVLVVMDADLQHPPEMVPVLASMIAIGACDVAVGSRFSNGGSATGLDGWIRRLNSQVTRQLTRVMLSNTRSIRDPLSGFFAVRRDVVANGPSSSDGFKILIDVLTFGEWTSAIEVPFGFQPRATGDSKADVAQGARFLRQLGRLAVSGNHHSHRERPARQRHVPVSSGTR